MDMARSEVRKLAAEDYSTTQHLEHASRQARERNYQDFLIVDVDAHHYESESYNEVFAYIESPVIRRQAVESAKRGARASMLGGTIGYQDIGGRITRHELRRHDIRRHDKLGGGNHRDVAMTLEWMDAMGVPACSRRRCCSSACIRRSRSKWRCAAPTIAGSASASSRSSRASSRCCIFPSTIPTPRTRPSRISATRRAWSDSW